MKKTIVIYGSSTGTCEGLAAQIAEKLGVKLVDVTALTAEVVAEHDNLILGTSTWGDGELQDDWVDGLPLLEGADLSGKTIALFGCGDSASYEDTFCDAMREIKDAVAGSGCKFVGAFPTDGYMATESRAVENGMFVGLALDEMNEFDQTADRIDKWVGMIEPEL